MDNNKNFIKEDYQGKENINHLILENRTSIKKSKISSKSFNNNVKNQIINIQEIFYRLSPKKNKRCLTQTDSQNNEYDLKVKKNLKKYNSFIENKLKKINNSLNQKEKINIKNFIFERGSNKKENNYFDIDYIKDENKCYFKESKKDNLIINNTNLDVYNRLYNKSYYNKKKKSIVTNEESNCTFNPQLFSSINIMNV